MNPFEMDVHFRWSDLDPNFHIRHSVYYDLCAQLRTLAFQNIGFSLEFFAKNKIGPVLFREECTFRKELHFGDPVKLKLEAIRLAKDGSRFSIVHYFMRNDVVCATLTIDGAFMNTELRKLTALPEEAIPFLDKIPKAEAFEWVTR